MVVSWRSIATLFVALAIRRGNRRRTHPAPAITGSASRLGVCLRLGGWRYFKPSAASNFAATGTFQLRFGDNRRARKCFWWLQIGATRFERATSCSQSRRSTKLSYAPSSAKRTVSLSNDEMPSYILPCPFDERPSPRFQRPP
jgi:hypothetical protein